MKNGIKYFSFPVVFDRRHKRLVAKCGFASHSIFIYVLQLIFGVEGYFTKWDEEDSLMLAHDNSIDAEYVTKVINTAIDVGLFDKELYRKFSILSSAEIQENFLEATKRRKYSVIKEEYRLVENEVKNKNVNISDENADVSKQKKRNKKKSNETKLNEKKSNHIKREEKEPQEGGSSDCAAAPSLDSAEAQSPCACGSLSEKERDDLTRSVMDSYNSLCSSLPPVSNVSAPRIKAVCETADFLLQHGGFEKYFERVARSDFLCGKNKPKWKATFDWLIKKENAVKVMEGNYDNPKSHDGSSFDTDDFFLAALKRSYGDIYTDEQLRALM